MKGGKKVRHQTKEKKNEGTVTVMIGYIICKSRIGNPGKYGRLCNSTRGVCEGSAKKS